MNRGIYISPVGMVGDETITVMARFVSEMFGFEVVRHTSFPEPDFAYDARRGQFSSTLILKNLAKVCPSGAVKFLAVTEADIFIPMVTFVFGQAQLSGKVALVSLARLSQKYYGLAENSDIKIRRARKEVAHELGHTFGLVHCRDRSCIMSLSTEILQVDVKSEDFCPGCWAMLSEELAAQKVVGRKGHLETQKKFVEARR